MNAAALQMQYKKMVYEKTAANRATLNDILKENFLFKGLDGDQMATLLDAMFMANFEAGKAIIEGAEGDNFYVVFEGECEVFVSKGGDEKMVLACGKGDSFGELALMYNAPRAATVRAKTDCVLFAVDRITFKFILMDDDDEAQPLRLLPQERADPGDPHRVRALDDLGRADGGHLRRRRDDHLAGRGGRRLLHRRGGRGRVHRHAAGRGEDAAGHRPLRQGRVLWRNRAAHRPAARAPSRRWGRRRCSRSSARPSPA